MRMRSRALLVLLLCSLLAGAANAEPSPDPTYKDCHPGDKAALLAFKAALGEAYHFASWTPDNPCCDWYDVTCDHFTGRGVGLPVFQDANLTGTIPSALAGLPHLQDLTLRHLPRLSGPIPPAIARLSNLSSLRISWTAVSGPVPSFLGALKKLTFLELSFNSLSGAIPASLGTIPNLLRISWTAVSGPVPSFLGALKKLTFLELSFNSLSGAIPASLGTIPNLSGINLSRNRLTGAIPPMFLSKSSDQVYLWLSHNNLTGPVPAGFAAVEFAHLDLSRNALTGDASGLFGRGKELQYIDLSRNDFDFDLSAVVLPEQLYFVDVSHNAIHGSIPAQVASLSNLQFFNVSYNRLCGPVPTGGNMERFDLYNFQHNKCLCGAPLPACKK
uniref:Polygalacturonase inhibitor n=1 Tax=Aegilops tauschii TaxID=37682 RepID=M8BJ43_AEGTA